MEPETAAKLAAGIAMGVGAIGPGFGYRNRRTRRDGSNRPQPGSSE